MNYPRIVRYESKPGSYENALEPYMMSWRMWGIRLNGHDGLGGVLGVCRADGTKDPNDGNSEANDWRARFEVTVWNDRAHQYLKEMGMPEDGTITLETDDVQEKDQPA